MTIFLRSLDRAIGWLVATAKWLALPLVAAVVPAVAAARHRALLFARGQRSRASGSSRSSSRSASRRRRAPARISPPTRWRIGTRRARARGSRGIGAAVSFCHGSLFVALAEPSLVISSVRGLEAFADTDNPGYFLIKPALWLMALAGRRAGLDRHLASAPADDALMEWSGLALLILVGAGIVSHRPAGRRRADRVRPASARSFGIAIGTFAVSLLSALPGRLINLFENDLLQALPLYVTMGLLLDRLPVADALYRTSHRHPAARAFGAARLRACCSARCSGR